MKKLSNTGNELKKSAAYKKKCLMRFAQLGMNHCK